MSFEALSQHLELSSEIAEAWLLLRIPSDCVFDSLGVRAENAMSALRIDLISSSNRTVIRHGTLGTNSETEIPLWFTTVTKLPVDDGLICALSGHQLSPCSRWLSVQPHLGDYHSLSTDLQWERLRDMGLLVSSS